MSFADDLAAVLPRALVSLPQPREALGWLEGRGPSSGAHLPVVSDTEIGFVAEAPHGAWLEEGPPRMALAARFHPIASTGGEGSQAAPSLGPDGVRRFVHRGSGSVWAGTITDDPVDLPSFLAAGQEEMCRPDTLSMMPPEALLHERGHDGLEALREAEGPASGLPEPPAALHAWTEARFGRPPLRVPADAARSPCPGDGQGRETGGSFTIRLDALQDPEETP